MHDDDTQLPCADKITYESPEEARAADAANSYHYDKPQLKVYRCRYCNLFHLTARTDEE